MLGVMTDRRTALVLAGGRSVRMGRSKALLPWGATTMLETVVGTLVAECARVVVVGHAGKRLPPLGDRVVRVDDPTALDDQGPLVGVHAGVAMLDDDDLVYLAATDKPHLCGEHIRFMFERLAETDAAVPIEPSDSGRRHHLHPLAGVLRVRAARPMVAQLVAEGERALRRVFERLRCTEVPVGLLPRPEVLHDYNTPEAYEAALRKP